MHQPQHIILYIHLGIRPLLTAVVCYLNRAKSYAILNNFFTSIFNLATNDFFVYFPAGIFLNASSHIGHTILPSGIDSLQKRHVLSLLILLLLSVEIFTSCHDNKIFFQPYVVYFSFLCLNCNLIYGSLFDVAEIAEFWDIALMFVY